MRRDRGRWRGWRRLSVQLGEALPAFLQGDLFGVELGKHAEVALLASLGQLRYNQWKIKPCSPVGSEELTGERQVGDLW